MPNVRPSVRPSVRHARTEGPLEEEDAEEGGSEYLELVEELVGGGVEVGHGEVGQVVLHRVQPRRHRQPEQVPRVVHHLPRGWVQSCFGRVRSFGQFVN